MKSKQKDTKKETEEEKEFRNTLNNVTLLSLIAEFANMGFFDNKSIKETTIDNNKMGDKQNGRFI